ncbi:MAG: glycosyltransferase family 2 protein [Saprospiraceae bacterium]|nr:glycosyltransferase family 2 protein [Saprospiraceae bacterium]
MNSRATYSAVIIARNEARTIQKCIEALKKITDDIIVVLDDRSDDDTYFIAQKLGAIIFRKKWEGFSANKNFGVEKAQNDWILCPDADEILNDVLIHNITSLHPDVSSVYEMNIRTWFGDYPVKHCGWFPDWNIRLYNKKTMSWNGNQVHEKLESVHPLKVKRIDGIIEHFSFVDEAHMVKKFDYYAQMRANEWISKNTKPSLIKSFFGPSFRFFRTYIFKLGFLDRKIGFTIAKNEYILKRKELEYFQKLSIKIKS